METESQWNHASKPAMGQVGDLEKATWEHLFDLA